jgi:hypothetical protein
LHRYVRDVLANQSDEERCCIIVDQFEEVLTLCHDPTTRTQFIDLLRYAATIAEGQTVVVITMRIDFLTSAAAYPPLAELLSMHPFIVSPMELADLRGVIERPAQLMGLRFEEGLVETILQDVGPEPGALPLLEHALLQLWERQRNHVMTWQAYREIGGVQGALAKRAEQIFEALTEVQQRITRRILLRLTQPGENTADTRRRSTLEELQIRAEDRHAVEEVVKTLADARLVVASSDQQVEVAHEALIRGWPRLRQWIDDNRAALRFHRRITAAAQEWQSLKHDEGVLFRRGLLTQAQEWRAQHEEDLNHLERAFLDASGQLERREARQAEILAEVKSHELATEALRHLADQPDLALLLSVEALQRAETMEARRALLTGLQSFSSFIGPVALLRGNHAVSVWSVAFSPDGKLLASGGEGGLIQLWEVEHRRPLGEPLESHTEGVMSVAFSPDGKLLASGGEDGRAPGEENGMIFLWDLDLHSWQYRACQIANRNFTRAEWAQYMGNEPYHATCPDTASDQYGPAVLQLR